MFSLHGQPGVNKLTSSFVIITILLFAPLTTGCIVHTPGPTILVPTRSTTPQDASPAVKSLGQDLTELFTHPSMAHTIWAVQVQSIDRMEKLYRLNDLTLLMPASSLKILTLAVAVDQLGWNFRYETNVLATGPIEQGVLQGDLIIRGTGDPTINAFDNNEDVFKKWVHKLNALGIHHIEGRIIGDDRAWSNKGTDTWNGLNAGWLLDDLPFGFAAPSGALQQHNNVADLTLKPGTTLGLAANVYLEQETSGLELVNRVITSSRTDKLILNFSRLPGDSRLEVTGSIPISSSPVYRTVSVDNPTTFFVNTLKHSLMFHGITVAGKALDIDDLPTEDRKRLQHQTQYELLVYQSSPLSKIATKMMKSSQNLFAETLLKTLEAKIGHESTTTGQQVIRNVMKTWNIDNSQLVITDGSGLSRYNLVTANALVRVLVQMYKNPQHMMLFEYTLPIAGLDGTLTSRMIGTEAEGNARGKTGTMTGVRTLAGYVKTRDNEQIAFAILANNFYLPSESIVETIDKAVERIAEFSRDE